ncbi:MAG: 13E12 repeat family protein, partial [Gammaproteobacteria bacterium]|nr:13E12 repeat family protein [Gammaproteobacteria bacterium]
METNTRDFGREHIDALDGAIVRLSARINAANYELLALIRQFDERAGWLRWGFDNCVEWLAWRCDLGLSAAREKVRVAHALKILPAVSASFASGTLSYSKVRAMTRVTHLVDEKELLAFALKTAA